MLSPYMYKLIFNLLMMYQFTSLVTQKLGRQAVTCITQNMEARLYTSKIVIRLKGMSCMDNTIEEPQ